MQTHAAARLHRVAIAPKGQNYELKIDVVNFIISIHCFFSFIVFLANLLVTRYNRSAAGGKSIFLSAFRVFKYDNLTIFY